MPSQPYNNLVKEEQDLRVPLHSDEAFHNGICFTAKIFDPWILFSKRKFKKVVFKGKISNGVLRWLNVVFQAHGNSIETLVIKSSLTTPPKNSIDIENLVEMFNQLPNLKTLTWWVKHVVFENCLGHDPTLKMLETLEMLVDNTYAEEFFNLFPENQLKKLTLLSESHETHRSVRWNLMEKFIQRQQSIVDLQVTVENLQSNHNVFDNLQLATFRAGHEKYWRGNFWYENFGEFLNTHQHLTMIEIIRVELSENDVRAIGTLEHLKELDLTVNTPMLNPLSNLRTLTKIAIRVMSDEIVSAVLEGFSLVELITAEIVEFKSVYAMTTSFKPDVAGQNWKKVKKLKIETLKASQNGLDFLNPFLDSFPNLEDLEITYRSDEDHRPNSQPENEIFFDYCEDTYPKMKSLVLNCVDSIKRLEALLAALPNLKKFKMFAVYEFYRTSQTHIANFYGLLEMQKLKELKITFEMSPMYPTTSIIRSLEALVACAIVSQVSRFGSS